MSIKDQAIDASKVATCGRIACWTDEPNEVVRLARLEEATMVMMQGDGEAAFRWLHSPLSVLNNQTPLEHALTEAGARHVDDLICRRVNKVFC